MPETTITIIPSRLHSLLTDVSTPHTLAELVAAVCSETEADTIAAALIATHAGLPNVHHTPTSPGWLAESDFTVGDKIAEILTSPLGGVERLIEDPSSASYIKTFEHCLKRGGTIRVKFNLRTSNADTTAYARIYRNGGAVGTEQSTNDAVGVVKSEDIAGWSAGDLLQLYQHANGARLSRVTDFILCTN